MITEDNILIFNSRPLIPINTELTKEEYNILLDIIKRSIQDLRDLPNGYIELSIWGMQRLEHLKALRDNNSHHENILLQGR